MGNCAGYCNGEGEQGKEVRQSFHKQDMMNNLNNQHNDFENAYGK